MRKPLVESEDMLGLAPGDYGRAADGKWYARPPLISDEWPKGFPPARLVHADTRPDGIVEHEDGTITVSPSIVFSSGAGEVWHGYLVKGIWTKC